MDSSLTLTRRKAIAGVAGGFLTATGGISASAFARDKSLPENRPTIIGHRGAAGVAPPNTIRGIKRALSIGADGVEIDVQQTKDGELVLFHDPILGWATNGNGRITEVDSDYLSSLTIHGEPIPTLDEALALLSRTNAEIFLELKRSGYTEDVLEEVRRHNVESQTTLVSFKQDALEPAQSAPVQVGLVGNIPNPSLINNALSLEADIALAHYVPRAIPWFITAAEASGLQSGVWSLIDTQNSIRDAIEHGPDVITVNRPDIALDMLRNL